MLYLITLQLLVTSILSNSKLAQQCSILQLEFASASSDFTTCLGKNTKPVRICVTCFKEFTTVQESFVNITQSKNCSTQLLDSDNAMVIRRLWDAYQNMWTSALCTTCSGLSVNRTLDFVNKTDEVHLCFNHNKQRPRTICQTCNSQYETLTTEFKQLQSYGYACADLADDMNSTAQSWSVTYACGHPPIEYLPVLSMTAGVSLLPVFFYLGVWKFGG